MPSDYSKNPSFKGLRPSSEASSRSKRSNKANGTKPETLLRSTLWRLGLRYRKNVANLPGKPDIVFTGARVVVFCDGDFWHGRDWDLREEKLRKGWNADYWLAKIQRNMERDRQNTKLLESDGWCVLRYWESDIIERPADLAQQVKELVDRRKALQKRRVYDAERSGE